MRVAEVEGIEGVGWGVMGLLRLGKFVEKWGREWVVSVKYLATSSSESRNVN